MSAPQSIIHICAGIRLNSRYEHSIYFASAAEQETYFAGKVVKTFSAYSYIRKSWSIKVEATMEQAKTWNYLFFRNTSSGKVYYYFINNIEYINDSTVELSLELDVLQTYLFDFSLLRCFVERQHTTTDTAGANTVDEGLELGELVYSAMEDVPDLVGTNNLCILVLSTVTLNGTSAETTVDALGYCYNNVFSGLNISAINLTDWPAWEAQLENLAEWVGIDGIVGMWMYPKGFITLGGESTWDDEDLAKTVASVAPIDYYPDTTECGTSVDGYTPKNKKLLTYPFNFLYVSNNNGGSAIYQYERFEAGLSFEIHGALSPEAGAKLVPWKYKNGSGLAYDEGLTMPGWPTCAWASDTYKLWLASNQHAHGLTEGTGLLKIGVGAVAGVAGLAMGNAAAGAGGLGMMANGALQIADLLAQKKDMELQPPQARGQHSATTNMANDKQTFTFYRKSVNAEHARIIDDYFTMYGYKINRVQVPNINARPAFTYVKTIGCHIKGGMCNEDTVKVEAIFDHGITWWKNGDSIGDYSLTNTP